MKNKTYSRRTVLNRLAVGTGAVGLGIGSFGTAAGSSGPATVTLDDQDARGVTVNVASTYLPEGGFVVIHDDRLQGGDALESVVGHTAYKNPGMYEDLRIAVDPQQVDDEDNLLIAMPHRNTNRSRKYDFVTSGGTEDLPYFDRNGVVIDSATVTF